MVALVMRIAKPKAVTSALVVQKVTTANDERYGCGIGLFSSIISHAPEILHPPKRCKLSPILGCARNFDLMLGKLFLSGGLSED